MEIQKVLEEIQNSKKGDENLYTLLRQIFSKILLENPSRVIQANNPLNKLNVFDVFEDFSHNVKANGFDFKNFKENAYRMKENCEEITDFSTKAKALLDKMNVGTEEEPQEPGACGYVPNFMQEAKIFEWAGVYFGEEESFKIYKSLTRLSITKPANRVKFWGKILCSERDYYIAEGEKDNADEQEYPPNVETKGTGVNRLNYWVTNDLFDEWVELPVIKPEHVVTARKIKYIFTGNLERDVVTNPHFDGKEKDLLKAQIVRISHTTNIVPKGMYRLNEDDPPAIEATEEYKPKTFEELSKLTNWEHYTQNILKEGRLTHMKPEIGDDEDEEKVMAAIMKKDPFEEKLKPITKDKPVNGYPAAWTIKTFSDTKNYLVKGFVNSQINYGIIALKSLIWPGFLHVYYKDQFSCIYVGYGFKATVEQFYPKEPQMVMEEPVEIKEQPEPNKPVEQEKPEGEEKLEEDA